MLNYIVYKVMQEASDDIVFVVNFLPRYDVNQESSFSLKPDTKSRLPIKVYLPSYRFCFLCLNYCLFFSLTFVNI